MASKNVKRGNSAASEARTEDPASRAPSAGAEGAPAPPRPRAWVRLAALAATLLTAWHILASFLWIAPFSANAREIVPGGQQTLSAYMLPFFGQSWSVFAPEPINGDYHFNVRALLSDGTETGWVSATDVELSMIRYNLFPPRAGIQSTELASAYKGAFDALEPLQRTVVGGNFAIDGWEPGLRAALESQIGKGAEAEGADEPAKPNTEEIDELIAEERRASAYATQVARAVWGADVEQVQFRVSRQNIIPFAERHDPHAERPEPSVVLPGWRPLIVEEGQNDGNFADVFRRQYERISR